jgi:hypothetical protein
MYACMHVGNLSPSHLGFSYLSDASKTINKLDLVIWANGYLYQIDLNKFKLKKNISLQLLVGGKK